VSRVILEDSVVAKSNCLKMALHFVDELQNKNPESEFDATISDGPFYEQIMREQTLYLKKCPHFVPSEQVSMPSLSTIPRKFVVDCERDLVIVGAPTHFLFFDCTGMIHHSKCIDLVRKEIAKMSQPNNYSSLLNFHYHQGRYFLPFIHFVD
jgi:hypothetical protein